MYQQEAGIATFFSPAFPASSPSVFFWVPSFCPFWCFSLYSFFSSISYPHYFTSNRSCSRIGNKSACGLFRKILPCFCKETVPTTHQPLYLQSPAGKALRSRRLEQRTPPSLPISPIPLPNTIRGFIFL